MVAIIQKPILVQQNREWGVSCVWQTRRAIEWSDPANKKKGTTSPAQKFVANKPNEPPIDCGSKHQINTLWKIKPQLL